MSQNVAEIVVETLLQAGAKRCYGVVGDTINHLTDAIRQSDMDWVHVRHEEVGGFAAGGEAFMTGELAVCAGTCGPGSLHFVNGIFESHRNGAPVVLIASQIATPDSGVDFPQDVDQRPIYEQCSVFCETLLHPNQARRLMALAAQTALAKRGVAVVIVPGNLFTQTPEQDLPYRVHRFDSHLLPAEQALEAAAERLNQGGKISIYAGFGSRDAASEVKALAARLNAPVAWTSRAKDFLEPDNPHGVGMTGIFGMAGGYHAVADCDTLLLLGCGFAWAQFYPERATIIQVDADPGQIGKRHPVDMALLGTVRDTCAALLERIDPQDDTAWLDQCRRHYLDALHEDEPETRDDALIHPQRLAMALNDAAAEDAVFTADGGSPMVWLLRHIRANGRRRTLTSLLHGTMANAYPQALGIQKAYPGRQVIALCGDGGMTMLLGDLLTLKQERVPIKILVLNNGSLGFVELEQKVEGLLDSYTDLENPDFGKMAQAMGLWGARVSKNHELRPALLEWLSQEGPAILDVQVNRMELVMPPKVELSQVASTALYSAKAVMSGRMDEVVDLLKSNFLE